MNLTPVVQPEPFRSDLHEAKHLHDAVTRMTPDMRFRWLRLCCLKVSPPGGARVDVVRSTREVREVLGDFYTICGQNGLTLAWATGLAEHLLRGRLVRDYFGQTGGD